MHNRAGVEWAPPRRQGTASRPASPASPAARARRLRKPCWLLGEPATPWFRSAVAASPRFRRIGSSASATASPTCWPRATRAARSPPTPCPNSGDSAMTSTNLGRPLSMAWPRYSTVSTASPARLPPATSPPPCATTRRVGSTGSASCDAQGSARYSPMTWGSARPCRPCAPSKAAPWSSPPPVCCPTGPTKSRCTARASVSRSITGRAESSPPT